MQHWLKTAVKTIELCSNVFHLCFVFMPAFPLKLWFFVVRSMLVSQKNFLKLKMYKCWVESHAKPCSVSMFSKFIGMLLNSFFWGFSINVGNVVFTFNLPLAIMDPLFVVYALTSAAATVYKIDKHAVITLATPEKNFFPNCIVYPLEHQKRLKVFIIIQ